jgi:hypothetical protein
MNSSVYGHVFYFLLLLRLRCAAGGWRNGAKHGPGTYLYQKVQCTLSGDWSNGQVQNGVWTTHDGTTYSGAFLSNAPNGAGVFQFAHGNAETGRFEVKVQPAAEDAAQAGEEEKKVSERCK